MPSLRESSLLIVDNGLFVSLAQTLAKDFGSVFYWSEYAGPFPRDAESAIGEGLTGVKRIKDGVELWRLIDGADKSKFMISFTDSYGGGWTEFLRKIGHRVWGPGPGEKIELDRYYAHDLFARLGIPMPEYKKITGTEGLKSYLKSHDDTYVKARYARIRGNFETHRCESFDLVEPWFIELESTLGSRKDTTEFLVEKSIGDAVEISSERYLIDRQFPAECMFSMEVKGDGAISRVLPTNQFPKQITSIDALLVKESWATGYRAPFTIETRVDKSGTPYPIDPCCRFGRPAWGTVSANVENLADIFWSGAEGVMVDPIHKEEWAVELMIECPKVGNQGAVLEIPNSVRPFVFLSDAYFSRGYDRVTAQDISNIGSVVGLGSSLDAAIKSCLDRADKIKGDGLKMATGCFDKAKESFDNLKDYGIDI